MSENIKKDNSEIKNTNVSEKEASIDSAKKITNPALEAADALNNTDVSGDETKKQAEGEVSEEKKESKASKIAKKRKGKKGPARQVTTGRAYVKATYNNTIVTLTDQNGNVLSWSSAGQCGFKGPKKSTPYAASMIVKNACEKAKKHNLKDVAVFVKGVGSGRESAVRALNANGLNIIAIRDITPIPHNGCRQRKTRRV